MQSMEGSQESEQGKLCQKKNVVQGVLVLLDKASLKINHGRHHLSREMKRNTTPRPRRREIHEYPGVNRRWRWRAKDLALNNTALFPSPGFLLASQCVYCTMLCSNFIFILLSTGWHISISGKGNWGRMPGKSRWCGQSKTRFKECCVWHIYGINLKMTWTNITQLRLDLAWTTFALLQMLNPSRLKKVLKQL